MDEETSITTPVGEWSTRIEMGLPSIDRQHRQLFNLAATFADDGDQVRVMRSIAMLCDYVKVHFSEEESLLEACAYPAIDAHRQMHANFRAMLVQLLDRARQMTLDEIAEEVRFLVNGWFYNHILIADFDYAPYVAGNTS